MGLQSPKVIMTARPPKITRATLLCLFGLAYYKSGFFYQDGVSNLQELRSTSAAPT
jgi:hypothetical protein